VHDYQFLYATSPANAQMRGPSPIRKAGRRYNVRRRANAASKSEFEIVAGKPDQLAARLAAEDSAGCWTLIFCENPCPLFGIMLPASDKLDGQCRSRRGQDRSQLTMRGEMAVAHASLTPP
jgi:hypothetical protein